MEMEVAAMGFCSSVIAVFTVCEHCNDTAVFTSEQFKTITQWPFQYYWVEWNGLKKPMTWSWPSRKEEHVEKKVTTMQMFLMQPVFWKISK